MNRRSLIKAFVAFGIVAPASIAKATPSPEQRIKDAVSIIKEALAEIHPEFEIRATGGTQRAIRWGDNADLGPVMQRVEIVAFKEGRDPDEPIKWAMDR
ncbi:hypothetical protein [Ahrensia marina]|uniref:Uncharacterized protein n=1 Tax=Ahrensia marina TaxID=1514904 RepID=A0A0N0E6H7_9HYPH|nr:hypothetical protein [Ahrensia marina]KPA99961.1 hypothetical protein SU32_16275 [Ahrensia marina]